MDSAWNLCFRSIEIPFRDRLCVERPYKGYLFRRSPVLGQAKPNFRKSVRCHSKLIFASWIWKHETKQSMAISARIFWRCNFRSRYYLSLIWGIRKNWEIAKRFNGLDAVVFPYMLIQSSRQISNIVVVVKNTQRLQRGNDGCRECCADAVRKACSIKQAKIRHNQKKEDKKWHNSDCGLYRSYFHNGY